MAKTKQKSTKSAKPERHEFQADVSRLLQLMVHSVYSQKEIFLRELISNAADACDKLRYQAITKPKLLGDDTEFKITITLDQKARTLFVSDNGIGMSGTELTENLGTIARSGTRAFLEELESKKAPDISQIGQFGVGFYSAFMVADQIDVISHHAGEKDCWHWASDGIGAFTVDGLSRLCAVIPTILLCRLNWLKLKTAKPVNRARSIRHVRCGRGQNQRYLTSNIKSFTVILAVCLASLNILFTIRLKGGTNIRSYYLFPVTNRLICLSPIGVGAPGFMSSACLLLMMP